VRQHRSGSGPPGRTWPCVRPKVGEIILYLPQVQDRDGKSPAQLEVICAKLDPDASLADVIRRLIREGIARYNSKKEAS